jgi:hypothetical protein
MSSKKKVTPPEPVFSPERPVPRLNYFLLAPDVGHSAATYHAGRITIVHSDEAYFQILDHGSGYEITDVSPGGGTKKISVDYSLAADLFASLKIFYHNADKINGEYWTIFQGEKI